MELRYILANTKGSSRHQKIPLPPLRSIFTSPPMLALAVAHIGAQWGNYTIMSGMPTYLANIQQFSIKKVMNFS